MIAAQNKNINLDSKNILKNTGCLSSATIQKMILRLLKDAKISKAKLAECLDITTTELLRLTETRASSELVEKISLPLVNHYCLTEFINQ